VLELSPQLWSGQALGLGIGDTPLVSVAASHYDRLISLVDEEVEGSEVTCFLDVVLDVGTGDLEVLPRIALEWYATSTAYESVRTVWPQHIVCE